jgi:hypothetical protein
MSRPLPLNVLRGNGRGRLRSPNRRVLPSMEKVLQALGPVGLPRAAALAVVRKEIAGLRQAGLVPGDNAMLVGLRANCERLRRQRLQPVINGTGFLLHTNLGRAPLGSRVVAHLSSIAANFNNLEYDLVEGGRGTRAAYLECNLALLCGAEAATVVLVPHAIAPADFAARMRLGFPPVVGYVACGCFRIDLRTVFPSQDEPLVHALRSATA